MLGPMDLVARCRDAVALGGPGGEPVGVFGVCGEAEVDGSAVRPEDAGVVGVAGVAGIVGVIGVVG